MKTADYAGPPRAGRIAGEEERRQAGDRSPAQPAISNPQSTHPGIINSTNFASRSGEKQARKSINLTLPPRSITALIRPSGCGKSTSLRSINRLNELILAVRTEAEIQLDGENIYAPGTDLVSLRQRVGMVFQRWNPLPR